MYKNDCLTHSPLAFPQGRRKDAKRETKGFCDGEWRSLVRHILVGWVISDRCN
ncbi:hypothetical protein [Nostoc sp. UHCC 0870]|uniref:hypothetical protein n=1 Tax=Nostoc sp. UHCC 0870 TaxID=2914041 RepID=UPI001EDDDE3B|nr:hypothetical protein [Nostoc sp. UHCC 0870]UKO97544.1 hypothetical protein L6494_23700 [Nostoc sp. UHCC 0870]